MDWANDAIESALAKSFMGPAFSIFFFFYSEEKFVFVGKIQ